MLFANQRHHYYRYEEAFKNQFAEFFFLILVINIQHLQFVEPFNLYWN